MANSNTKNTEINSIETYFFWYLNELKEAGYIHDIKREPFSIQLTPPKKHKKMSYKKKVPQIEEFSFLNQSSYKFDYMIVWNISAKEYFYNLLDENLPIRIECPFYAEKDIEGRHVSLVDVKTTSLGSRFGNNTSAYTFPYIQKILYHFYGFYINKAIPIPTVQKGEVKSGNSVALFTSTFVPKRYLLTDSGKQARNIVYRHYSLKEYVYRRAKEIAQINNLIVSQTNINFNS